MYSAPRRLGCPRRATRTRLCPDRLLRNSLQLSAFAKEFKAAARTQGLCPDRLLDVVASAFGFQRSAREERQAACTKAAAAALDPGSWILALDRGSGTGVWLRYLVRGTERTYAGLGSGLGTGTGLGWGIGAALGLGTGLGLGTALGLGARGSGLGLLPLKSFLRPRTANWAHAGAHGPGYRASRAWQRFHSIPRRHSTWVGRFEHYVCVRWIGRLAQRAETLNTVRRLAGFSSWGAVLGAWDSGLVGRGPFIGGARAVGALGDPIRASSAAPRSSSGGGETPRRSLLNFFLSKIDLIASSPTREADRAPLGVGTRGSRGRVEAVPPPGIVTPSSAECPPGVVPLAGSPRLPGRNSGGRDAGGLGRGCGMDLRGALSPGRGAVHRARRARMPKISTPGPIHAHPARPAPSPIHVPNERRKRVQCHLRVRRCLLVAPLKLLSPQPRASPFRLEISRVNTRSS
ncbi:hypothetical protein B0H17DRAFT_1126333 [Mycena rosella]|uniref:Uncharacterized protein n=1 Tax=Mycena rosella TaxID=1033263 RepID=A0AAD7GUS0_MYCRO|nr:hypothetical protein B0H17DRAFT_1126333 [Mycena rosella]